MTSKPRWSGLRRDWLTKGDWAYHNQADVRISGDVYNGQDGGEHTLWLKDAMRPTSAQKHQTETRFVPVAKEEKGDVRAQLRAPG